MTAEKEIPVTASSAIERLRELRSKATPGEWEAHRLEHHISLCSVSAKSDGYALMYLDRSGEDSSEIGHALIDANPAFIPENLANAEAIVAAMNALPALLDAVEALERIADGRGRCSECGEWAIGSVGGVVGYGCCDSPRSEWQAVDPKETARAALDALAKEVE